VTLAGLNKEVRTREDHVESRILIVQYAGDYLAAYERLQQRGGEIYHAHGYVLEQATSLGAQYGDAALLCCRSPRQYEIRLPEGLTVMGAGADPRREKAIIQERARRYDPTHVVVLGPLTSVLQWGAVTGRRTLGIFADSFETPWVRRLYRYGRLGALLNSPQIEWIANHGLNACRSLARIGVSPTKIIPWDFPHPRRPTDLTAKSEWDASDLTLLYVGVVSKAKGVSDVIEALRYLRDRGLPFRLKIVGEGDLERFRSLAQRLNLEAHLDFLGAVSNETVLQLMRKATIVTIPSRHEYPEGMPFTIYEALCARTPIVASDHPMFRGHLRDRETAMVFPAGHPQKLASKIEELISCPALYYALSAASVATWEGLQLPVKWGDLLHRWVRSSQSDHEWLSQHSLGHSL